MCGIHGFINGKTKAEVNTDDFIKSGFVTNMLRGTDSSGIGIVTPGGFADVAKIPLAGMYLSGNKHANGLISRARSVSTAAICHVRAATSGMVNYANAHPFHIVNDDGDEILGCHNGTLQNWSGKKEGKDWDVDSAWALSRILNEGVDAFEEFTGAFAFVWWTSKDPSKLKMARNKERPLFVGLTEDDNLVYASEAGMIHWLCERHRIKLKGSIKELEEGRMYTFDINDPSKYTKSEALPTPKAVVRSNNNSSMYDYRGNGSSAYQSTCDKLNAIFDKIDKEQPKAGTQLSLVSKPESTVVITDTSQQEVEDAHILNVLGTKGTFRVWGTSDDSGYLYGDFEADDVSGEMHAVMRNVPEGLDWVTNDVFDVKVQGVKDTDGEFLFVVSAPLPVAA